MAYVLGELLICLYCFYFFMKDFCFNHLWQWFRIHVAYGVFGLLMRVVSEMNNNILVLIAGYFLTLKETGIISFVMVFTKSISLLSSAVQINFNPIFVEKYSQKKISEILAYTSKIYHHIFLMALPLFVTSVLLYYMYIRLFMGESMLDSVYLYLIVAFGTLLCFIFQWPSSMLILSANFRKETERIVLVVIVKIFLTYMLTKSFGIMGNLLSYTITEVFSIFICYYLIYSTLYINLFESIKRKREK